MKSVRVMRILNVRINLGYKLGSVKFCEFAPSDGVIRVDIRTVPAYHEQFPFRKQKGCRIF